VRITSFVASFCHAQTNSEEYYRVRPVGCFSDVAHFSAQVRGPFEEQQRNRDEERWVGNP